MAIHFVSMMFTRPGTSVDPGSRRATEVFLGYSEEEVPPAGAGDRKEAAAAERARALDAEVAASLEAWRACASRVRGKPVAIEVLWDGDSDGWFVCVSLIVSRQRWWFGGGGYAAEPLGTLRYGGDLRIFAGQVPPWPEAIVARRAGEALAREMGTELYFPSPEEPASDCPEWWARDRAITCRTCKKALKRDRGPYASPGLCYRCARKAREQQDLLDDAPGGLPGVHCVVVEADRVVRTFFFGLDGVLLAAAHLARALAARSPGLPLTHHIDTRLMSGEIAAVVAGCEADLEALLSADPPPADVPVRGEGRLSFTWRGVERSVDLRGAEEGSEIGSLLAWREVFQSCTGARELLLVGNGGVSRRDVALLLHLRSHPSPLATGELQGAFPFLPGEVLQRSLARLERRRLVSLEGDAVRAELRGRVQTMAGPR